jgi:hypothetical protein
VVTCQAIHATVPSKPPSGVVVGIDVLWRHGLLGFLAFIRKERPETTMMQTSSSSSEQTWDKYAAVSKTVSCGAPKNLYQILHQYVLRIAELLPQDRNTSTTTHIFRT